MSLPMDMQLLKGAISLPKPVISHKYKKKQAPAYDTFGPFPDETILSSIDRLLFMLGAHKVLNLLTPCTDASPSEVSINVELPAKKPCICSPSSTESSFRSLQSKALNSPKSCLCPKRCKGSCCRKSSSRTQITEQICCDKPPVAAPPCPCTKSHMKRSFSLCSLACRKLKEVCFISKKRRFEDFAAGCKAPKWIWTRMRSHPSGCEIYEVFKKSCTCMHPSKIDMNSCPKLIFIVLPNGAVMPFETLTSHL